MNTFAFFGTPALACEILDALLASGHTPTLIVTMPDRPQGRGMVMTPSPVATWAAAHHIETLKPEKLDDEFVANLRARGISLAVVVAYGKIVPQSMLDSFERGMWNIHYSLLPRWRGATPVESAILAGDTETGVCIQRMVYALDAGPIAAIERTPIAPSETTPELRARLNATAARLLVSLFPALKDGSVTLTEQDATHATRCGKMVKEDGDITDDNDATRLRKYRAYAVWPRTYFYTERAGARIRVKVAAAHGESERFVIDRVVPEGRREMSYADFLRVS